MSIHTTSKYIERMVPLIYEGLGFFETFDDLYRVCWLWVRDIER